MPSSLWLLEAKPFVVDDRSITVQTVKYWLKPGTVIVGRKGQAELAVEEDKSISRKHAEITIPQAQEGDDEAPYVLLKDSSKYGTWVSQSNTFDDDEKLGTEAVHVHPNDMVKFGYKSPFKLYHQDWVLYLGAAQRNAADARLLQALQEAAIATGLPLSDELTDHPGTRVLALGAAPLHVDSATLVALLRGYPIVGASWLLEWQQQKVWCNSRPEEAAYPVNLQYAQPDGRLKSLASADALRSAAEQQLLAGRSLLWLAAARDSALQEAARLMGAANSNVAASGHAATAAARSEGAVLVLAKESDSVPAAYRKLPWTTRNLLLAAMLEGTPGAAIRPPAAQHTTPAGKAKARSGAEALDSTATAKGRGRARSQLAQEDEQQGEGSGTETDAGEDVSHVRSSALCVLALDTGAKAAEGPSDKKAQVERQQQQMVQQEAAEPAASQGGGRKRRQPERERAEQGQAAEPLKLGPAKKRRRQDTTRAAAAAALALPAAPVEQPTLPLLDAAAGWHTVQHRQVERRQPEAASPGSQSPSEAMQFATSAAGAKRGGLGARRGRNTATLASEDELPTEAPASSQQTALAQELSGEEGDDEGASVVTYLPLVVSQQRAAQRTANNSSCANFKAFRKGGGGMAAAAAMTRPLIAFDEQPYAEDGPLNGDAFVRAEAERRQKAQQADELFSANVKARKAAAMPNPDGDSPPPPAGRGRGRGTARKAPAAGQRSMLNFLPTPGSGRGRGRGRGKG